MQWIKTEEKKPECGQAVLIYQTYPKGTKFICVARPLIHCFYTVAQYDYKGDFVDFRSDVYKHVSHWMPLPEKPSEN